jgi:CRISPR-associated protein
MQELGIIARFPLGVYTGHKQDGNADTFPEPVRLHAALVSSAAQGSLAFTNEKGELEPSKASLKAPQMVRGEPARWN